MPDLDMQLLQAGVSFWKPPKKLKLSEWADEYAVLSAESAAESGRWRTLPYQREVMDAFSDSKVEMVVWQKSARVGATKIFNHLCALSYAPGSMFNHGGAANGGGCGRV
jgi:terminase, large subunit